MNEVWREKAHGLIKQISEGIATSMGGSVKIEIKAGYPALDNDPKLTQRSRDLASELLGSEHVTDMDIRMTAEDFAWFSLQYPAMMYRLGVRFPDTDEVLSLHSSRFIANEHALKTGVSLLT